MPHHRFAQLLPATALTLTATFGFAGTGTAGSSAGHSVTIRNQTGVPVFAKAYDNDDAVMIFPVSVETIPAGQSVALKCNTNGSCTLELKVNPPDSDESRGATKKVSTCNAVTDNGLWNAC